MQTQEFTYFQGTTRLQGYCAWNPSLTTPKPGILIAPDWSGCNEFAKSKAREMAEWGYVGIALDLYGEGQVGETDEEKRAFFSYLMEHRTTILLERIRSAYAAAKELPQVDPSRMGAMGFCFGGLCVLDLARSGAELQGVASFHGLLARDPSTAIQPIRTKIIAFHGYEDPMAPPDQLAAFEQEMRAAEVDWQVHVYGQVLHAFTNPQAHNLERGLVYHERAATRAWHSLKLFYDELFL
jgi:dienelactone hydrolase